MENTDKELSKSIKRASILSGIGMGLLLGLIMGLSVSEVVKLIMGTLTAVLGAFLGFDKRKFKGVDQEEYRKESENALYTALRAGWFGLAVVFGLLAGMLIRTNEVFTISLSNSVKQYTDAGFDPAYARKLVIYQRLGINPNTGELGPQTEVQRAHQSNLFSSEQAQSLCGSTDPDQWNKDWSLAKKNITALNNKQLTAVLASIEELIPDTERFAYLYGLNNLLCYMGKNDTKICLMGKDLAAWDKNEATKPLANLVSKLSIDKQAKLMESLSALVCELEKK